MKTKNLSVSDFHIKELENGNGEIQGYASVFGNIDAYGDIVMKGAFSGSLKEKMPKLLWQHDHRTPIGKWIDAYEDEHGLFVRGELFLNIYQARNAYELIKGKAIDGLSIGYRELQTETNQDGNNLLLVLDLLEVSVVTFPANELATINGVKSALMDGKLPELKEFEKFLRDAGFSRSQAVAITNHGLKYLHGERVSQPDIKQFVSELQQFNALKLH